MAPAPAAMKPGRWMEAAPAVRGEGVAEALSLAGELLVALIRGVELAMWLMEGMTLRVGMLVMTGVQVDEGASVEVSMGVSVGVSIETELEVEVGVGVGVDDGGGV